MDDALDGYAAFIRVQMMEIQAIVKIYISSLSLRRSALCSHPSGRSELPTYSTIWMEILVAMMKRTRHLANHPLSNEVWSALSWGPRLLAQDRQPLSAFRLHHDQQLGDLGVVEIGTLLF
jgi:hypothetical protein